MSESLTLCFSYEVVVILTGKVDFSCNNRHSTINDCKSYTNGYQY